MHAYGALIGKYAAMCGSVVTGNIARNALQLDRDTLLFSSCLISRSPFFFNLFIRTPDDSAVQLLPFFMVC